MATPTSQLIEQRLPDNDTGRIFPEDVRQVAHALDQQAPNQRRGGPFFVTFLTQAEAVAAGRAGDGSLETLDPALLCLGARAHVELHPDGSNAELVLVFDGTGQGLAVALNGNFERTIAGKWVEAASAEAVNANVPYFDPQFNSPTGYPVAYLVRYAVPGGQEAFYYSRKAGQLPAPTGAGGDPNWRLVPGPVVATQLSQRVTLFEAQGLEGAGVVEGRYYAIVGVPQSGVSNPAANTWNQSGLEETVYVRGVESWFERQGLLLDANGQPAQLVSVDVATGTYQVLVSTSDFQSLQGKARDNADLAGELDKLLTRQDFQDFLGTNPAVLDAFYELREQVERDGSGITALLATQQQHGQLINTNTTAISGLTRNVVRWDAEVIITTPASSSAAVGASYQPGSAFRVTTPSGNAGSIQLTSANGSPPGRGSRIGFRVAPGDNATTITDQSVPFGKPAGASSLTIQPGEVYELLLAISPNNQYYWQAVVKPAMAATGPATTDDLAEGGSRLYFTPARAVASPLAGYSKTNTLRAIVPTDTVSQAIALNEARGANNAYQITQRTQAVTVEYGSSTGDNSYVNYRLLISPINPTDVCTLLTPSQSATGSDVGSSLQVVARKNASTPANALLTVQYTQTGASSPTVVCVLLPGESAYLTVVALTTGKLGWVVLGRDNTATLTAARTTLPFDTKTADYTLVAADAGTVIRMSSSAALTVTIPASANIPLGAVVEVRQAAAGAVTVVGAANVTLNAFNGITGPQGLHGGVRLHQTALGVWNMQPLGVVASGNGAGPASGIDYANPIPHTAAGTLTDSDLNKLHVLSGADFTLSLPANPAAGARLRLQVASDATGFYTLSGNGANLNGQAARLLWATESAELVYSGTEWVKLSGLSRAMSLRIKLSEASFTYTTNQALRVPCRTVVGSDPARLHNPADGTVQLRRAGKYGVVAFNAIQSAPAGSHCETFARLSGQNSDQTILNTIVPTSLNLAFGSAVGTMVCAATDYIELAAYCNQGGQALLNNPNTISNLLVEEHLDW